MQKFDFDDIVCAKAGVPELRIGARAWVVGIASGEERSGSYYTKFQAGTIYTIEFEDGESMDVHESNLARWIEAPSEPE